MDAVGVSLIIDRVLTVKVAFVPNSEGGLIVTLPSPRSGYRAYADDIIPMLLSMLSTITGKCPTLRPLVFSTADGPFARSCTYLDRARRDALRIRDHVITLKTRSTLAE